MLISLQVARAFLQPGCFDDGNYRCLIRSTSELAGAGGMAAKVWSKSEGLGPVGEAEAGTEGAEGAVAGNEGEAGGEGVGGDKHVHGGEGVASLPGGGAEVGVGFRGGGVPGQNADAHEKLVAELVNQFLMGVSLLPWDSAAAQAYSDLCSASWKRGHTLAAMDLLVAAHAFASGLTTAPRDR